jgi:lipopolysaccharide biosynthesis glycosyltransferase
MRDPDLDSLNPTYFAAYGPWEGGYTRFHFGGWQHFNSGVMLMNTPRMAERSDAFIDFVLNDGYDVERRGGRYWNKHLLLSDQVAYNLFYQNEIDNLPVEYNWNPSKGKNERAEIIHFNGLKWNQIDEMKEGRINKPQYKRMYQDADGTYEYYREMANELLNRARFSTNLDTV